MRVLDRADGLRVNPRSRHFLQIDLQLRRTRSLEALELRNGLQHRRIAVLADIRQHRGRSLFGLLRKGRARSERLDPPVSSLYDPDHFP